MSLQVVIGSNPDELTYLTSLTEILEWVDTVTINSYGTEAFPATMPFDHDQLTTVREWIGDLHTLLTDPSIFADTDLTEGC